MLAREILEKETAVNLYKLPNSEHNERSVIIGQLPGAVQDVARAYALSHPNEIVWHLSGKQVVAKLINKYDTGVRTK